MRRLGSPFEATSQWCPSAMPLADAAPHPGSSPPPPPLCREGGKCSVCGSFNRVRQLAAVILPHASRMTGRKLQVGCRRATAFDGARWASVGAACACAAACHVRLGMCRCLLSSCCCLCVQSLKEVAATDLRIFSAQSCSGPLHDVLKKAPGYVCRWGARGQGAGPAAAVLACCCMLRGLPAQVPTPPSCWPCPALPRPAASTSVRRRRWAARCAATGTKTCSRRRLRLAALTSSSAPRWGGTLGTLGGPCGCAGTQRGRVTPVE